MALSTVPVSVVIPVFNHFPALADAVRSAQRQTTPPAEIIVIDDGSTDGSAQAALQTEPGIGGPALLRVVRQPNGGPSAARNRGITMADQEWVAFLDADDLWFPERLELQWGIVSGRPGTVLCSADWLRPGVPRPTGPVPSPTFWSSVQATPRILWLNRFQTSTVLARRSALLEAGLFDPSMDGFEDWDLWMRVAALGEIAHLPYPLVVYPDTPGGVSKDTHRAYTRGLDRLTRYRRGEGNPAVARWVTPKVLVWHQLRFAFAFRRLGDREMARHCLRQSWRPGSRLVAVRVAALGLAPFLLGRILRRLRPGRPDNGR